MHPDVRLSRRRMHNATPLQPACSLTYIWAPLSRVTPLFCSGSLLVHRSMLGNPPQGLWLGELLRQPEGGGGASGFAGVTGIFLVDRNPGASQLTVRRFWSRSQLDQNLHVRVFSSFRPKTFFWGSDVCHSRPGQAPPPSADSHSHGQSSFQQWQDADAQLPQSQISWSENRVCIEVTERPR